MANTGQQSIAMFLSFRCRHGTWHSTEIAIVSFLNRWIQVPRGRRLHPSTALPFVSDFRRSMFLPLSLTGFGLDRCKNLLLHLSKPTPRSLPANRWPLHLITNRTPSPEIF